MSLPTRIAAYDDCIEVFDQAKDTGARVKFSTREEGERFAFRMRQARALISEENTRIYPKGDPRWGKTDYDRLVVRGAVEDTEGFWWVYIELYGSNILEIEPLEAPTFLKDSANAP